MVDAVKELRILGGSAKGTVLETPRRGTRPSPSRLREAVFDALQFAPRTPFLDLYAGTGAIGLEAASRGFPVTLVERARPAAAVLRRNARRAGLDVEVLEADALRVARDRPDAYGVAFVAPPYPGDLTRIFTAVLDAHPVASGGRWLLQHPSRYDATAALADALARVGAAPPRVRRYGSNAVTEVRRP